MVIGAGIEVSTDDGIAGIEERFADSPSDTSSRAGDYGDLCRHNSLSFLKYVKIIIA